MKSRLTSEFGRGNSDHRSEPLAFDFMYRRNQKAKGIIIGREGLDVDLIICPLYARR